MFLGITTIGLGVLYRLETGLDQRMVLPKDSHLIKYYDYLERYVSVGPPVFFVVSGGNLSQYESQRALCARFQNCSMDSISNILERERKASYRSMISDTPSSWIDDFFLWLNPEFDRCCRLNGSNFCQSTIDSNDCTTCLTQNVYEGWLLNGPKGKNLVNLLSRPSIFSESHMYLDHEFYDYLKLYLQAIPSSECPLAGKAMYSHALNVDFEHEKIYGSHFRTFHTPLRSQQDYIRALREARRISSEMEQANKDFKVFPYSVFYPFFEQYMHIVKTAIFTLCMPLCKWVIPPHIDTFFLCDSMDFF